MAGFNAKEIKSLARHIYSLVQTNASTWADELEVERARWYANANPTTGRRIQSSKGNGIEATYFKPADSEIEAREYLRRVERLIELVDAITAALGTPTAAEIWAELVYRLKPARRVRRAYSSLRLQ